MAGQGDTQIAVHRTIAISGGQRCARVGIEPRFKACSKAKTLPILESAKRTAREALRRSGHGTISGRCLVNGGKKGFFFHFGVNLQTSLGMRRLGMRYGRRGRGEHRCGTH
ncbi:hypothetical protein ERO13_A12G181600v2 [Gossypium hirsutum]|uniref:Uncharacterized protein n=3 Tax=Gossypium TaxID=3633 RepID=A0A1U8NUE3_GOSHI|nr:uncharacterized protein LOC107951237 [Gossypium hirsutum]KAG4170995.1 hypothetical protein ERO13_A12G181600v2 [Gossypium hirsutum]TYH96899.1 hypothetical protein ES332_A12G209000v1 [Gossypium tomentosum]TYJ05908.1 hypothetical protein E1A91_A12G196300v1 [Gossypium mustelinum]